MKGGPLSGNGFKPDRAAVALDDLLADGEPDSGALIAFPGVQPLGFEPTAEAAERGIAHVSTFPLPTPAHLRYKPRLSFYPRPAQP